MPTDDVPPDRTDRERRAPVSRRAAMGLLGLGGLGLLAGPAAAQPPADSPGKPGGPTYSWDRDVDANGHALAGLGALAMAGGPAIADFEGDHLSVDDGVLNVGLPAPPEPPSAAAASLYLETTTTLEDDVPTRLPFDAVAFDESGAVDLEQGWYWPDEPGVYQVHATASIDRFPGRPYPEWVQLRLVLSAGPGDLTVVRVANHHLTPDLQLVSPDFFTVQPAVSALLDLGGYRGVAAEVVATHPIGDPFRLLGAEDGAHTVLSVHRVG